MSDEKNDKIVEINETLDRLARLVEANASQVQANTRQLRDDRAEAKRQLAEDRAEWKRQRDKERAEDRAEAKLRQEEADRRQEEADRRQEEADRRQARLDVKAEQMMEGINALRKQYQEEGDRWGKITELILH